MVVKQNNIRLKFLGAALRLACVCCISHNH
jgi:hypothetical protein